MERISKTELAKRLDEHLQSDVGMKGLNTLLSGWKQQRRFGDKYRHALNARDWLYVTEVMDLSEYAGYDLTKKSAE